MALLVLILLEIDQAPLSRAARSTTSAAPDRTPVVDLEAQDLEFEMPALSLYSDITARPLFSPTRRPQAPDQTPVEEEPAPVSRDLVLHGVATAGKDRVALIEERATGELVRAIEGQSVGGWRVTVIKQQAVELEGRGDRLMLEVEPDSSPPMALERARQRRLQRADPRSDRGGQEADRRETPVRTADDQEEPKAE